MTRTLLLAAIVVAALATGPARAEAVFPPGSKVGLAPPAGFKPSENFRGFEEKLSGAAILTLELPAQAYGDIEKAMTGPALKKQGVIVEKREALALKSGKGVLLVGRQEADGKLMRKWILLGATPVLTALVTVLVPDSAKGTYSDAAIRQALASVEVRDSVPIDEQMGLLPYRVDELGGLRASRVVAPNTVILTAGPKDTLDATEQALLVISAAPGGPDETQQRDNFARNLFAGYAGLKDVHILGTDLIRLAGQQTHQLMAEAKDAKTDADVKLVQWVRFGNGAYLRFLGIAKADSWSDAFPRFRAVRDGVGPRP
ncbi:MAG TPA: hypothetical protein VLN57_10120 [Xanthobacteraceae bacterium]|nr:hypothetical protein [Xanthobacteraceae bacterium]